jgi:putative endonuclease
VQNKHGVRNKGGVRAKDSLGRWGEDVAVAHLRAAGMAILQRNWRCRLGEVDVVALDGGCLVVCEVKTRRSAAAGGPLEAVTPAKLSRLRRLTAAWLAGQGTRYAEIRIDVIGVFAAAAGPPRVEHLRGVG